MMKLYGPEGLYWTTRNGTHSSYVYAGDMTLTVRQNSKKHLKD